MSEEDKLTVEDQMIEEEFQGLLNDYLNSNHRRKVDVITRAFNMARRRTKVHAGVRVSPISCIRCP